ncbi:acyl-CoA dehydrogenase family protein [Hyphomonas johnsonii]|uniref:Acyl-CoA dehydrogenase n=1 Tax=Hyphomonas johnsonii MHS-2 TaxID=1280950 RepID=A0A059FRS5_9PROT|nr:acyl-CoA dehydrogenase family protein [Hyphomonas johnsonii]KCZ93216.1 acyl-CoA dehydrogenase [Hyphomonas johnsonii MHS-2]
MIDLQPSDEQQQIIDSVSSYLADNAPIERLTAPGEVVVSQDGAMRHALAGLGVFGIGVAEEFGGVGYGIAEEALVAREFGRVLLSPSLLMGMVAPHVALTSGNLSLAGDIMSGETAVGAGACITAAAESLHGDWHLIDSRDAALMLLCRGDRIGLFAANDLTVRRDVLSMDWTLDLERAEFAEGCVGVDSASLCRRVNLLVAAYMVGAAEAATQMSVDYACVRHQFNQPIGSFQAVKHRCADMLAASVSAWSQTAFAVLAHADQAADAAYQAHAACMTSKNALFNNGAANIQNHGGIGFTGEHTPHLFVKRGHFMDRIGDTDLTHRLALLEKFPSGSHSVVNF